MKRALLLVTVTAILAVILPASAIAAPPKYALAQLDTVDGDSTQHQLRTRMPAMIEAQQPSQVQRYS
ncbi:hypothetical protein KUV41_18230 [Halomonas sp. DP8Y7-1]|uniref:hypothetical protein n=1 Tax=Halomonas sp. DP8Y7-1 TaxID=2859078 RepID=UPI001C980ED7|nr:hypothetical protein [Halomonas sp. DP8Y7-1]MBY6031303.1 hypothetical protein [Halomonas sp. DP8Y7-1]